MWVPKSCPDQFPDLAHCLADGFSIRRDPLVAAMLLVPMLAAWSALIFPGLVRPEVYERVATYAAPMLLPRVRAPRALPPTCVATTEEDKALLAASKKVTLVAKRFGIEQGKAAQTWVEEAIRSGDTDTDKLMQMQLALFAECSVDDESGRCKALSEAIDSLTVAVADRKKGKKVDSFQMLTGATPIQTAATKLRESAASFGTLQKDAADKWIKKLTSGEATVLADASGLLEEQVALFGECVLSDEGTPSNCQQLEEALAELQSAIDACDISTPEKEEVCQPEEVVAELAQEEPAAGEAPAKETGRKRRAVKKFLAGLFSSGNGAKQEELSALAVAQFLAAPEEVDAALKGASTEQLVADLKEEGVSDGVITMACVAVLPYLAK